MLYQQVWSSEYPANSKELGMECYAKQLGETKVMDKDDEEYIIKKICSISLQFYFSRAYVRHCQHTIISQKPERISAIYNEIPCKVLARLNG